MTEPRHDLNALAKGGRTNIFGFLLRLAARLPFLFIAGRLYGPEIVGRFALAVLVVEFAAMVATLGLKRGLAQALTKTDRPHVHVVWDAMVVAFVASVLGSALLFAFPQAMYPNSHVLGFERFLPCIVFAIAWSDVSLAALAYRLNVKASVTARAVVEPWTISIAAWVLYYVSARDGLILAYVLSMLAALVASLVPFIRTYGLPYGWTPKVAPLIALARRNAPLAGADVIEWATRNVDRFILGLLFAPAIVGVYYMAQQVATLPGKLKTSFDPVLGPVITQSLKNNDRAGVAKQVRQVGFWIMAAQAGITLMLAVPGEAVMGVVGPQFVAGTAALAFLLTAEVLASTGAVCESALVYIARHINLAISAGVLALQIMLSFVLVAAMRSIDWDASFLAQFGSKDAVQAAGVAVALMTALSVGSVIKANLLSHLLGARVAGWRWPLVWAALAALLVGMVFTSLPKRFEWAELMIGVPAIGLTYCFILWRWAFGPADRALFRKVPNVEAIDLKDGKVAEL